MTEGSISSRHIKSTSVFLRGSSEVKLPIRGGMSEFGGRVDQVIVLYQTLPEPRTFRIPRFFAILHDSELAFAGIAASFTSAAASDCAASLSEPAECAISTTGAKTDTPRGQGIYWYRF